MLWLWVGCYDLVWLWVDLLLANSSATTGCMLICLLVQAIGLLICLCFKQEKKYMRTHVKHVNKWYKVFQVSTNNSNLCSMLAGDSGGRELWTVIFQGPGSISFLLFYILSIIRSLIQVIFCHQFIYFFKKIRALEACDKRCQQNNLW